MSKSILEVNDLTKVYGRELHIFSRKMGRKVVGAQNVSFKVKHGEIFGFLGPNGAGKTTTMRAILDYLKIQNGTITIFGKDYHQDSISIRKRIGYVPGDLSLYENFTGLELIKYVNNFRPVDKSFLEELKSIFRADLTLKIGQLSKGNRQQVGLIVALGSKPEFLILDEPTAGLDPLMTSKFHKVLRKLKQGGHTIFLSSHDLSEVQAICDRVGIIKEGKIILVESIDELKSKFLQHVSIKFDPSTVPSLKDQSSLDSVIDVQQTSKTKFKLKIKEDVNELLKFLTQYKVQRITIEDASLEEIFLQYYQ
ncbi:MAG: ATP-binding cassette domain-containing protein [Candidatus Hodarchaeales archaeon]